VVFWGGVKLRVAGLQILFIWVRDYKSRTAAGLQIPNS